MANYNFDIEVLHENGAFEDFADYHYGNPGKGEVVYECVKSGMMDLAELEDFTWGDYA